MELTRRGLLNLGGGVLGGSALSGCTSVAALFCATDGPVAAIDAHCHVHNAADLSIRGFLEQSILGGAQQHGHNGELKPERRRYWVRFAGFVAKSVGKLAPAARREQDALYPDYEGVGIKSLDALEREKSLEKLDPTEDEILGSIAQALEELEQESAEAKTIGPSSAIVDGNRKKKAQSLESADRLFQDLLDEAGTPAGTRTKAAFQKAGFFRGIARKLLQSVGLLGRALQWAMRLTKSRTSITEELISSYGGKDRVMLFTPMLLDYTYWLNDPVKLPKPGQRVSKNDVRLYDQMRFMGAMQAHYNSNPDSPSFHGFMAFDPARNAIDGGESLERVKQAVNEHGFIGVKLYPTMGFLPFGNSKLPIQSYTNSIMKLVPGDIGARLDSSLRALYRWCNDAGVPILTHANTSYGSVRAYEDRAAPEGWAPVFKEFSALRVNLAHFGDFLIDDDQTAKEAWEMQTIRLIAKFPGQAFSDFSFHAEALESGKKFRNAVRNFQKYSLPGNPLARGYLYGSDWFLLAIVGGHRRYLDSFDDFLDATGISNAAKAAILRDNAVEYLGLHDMKGTGGRLKSYYEGLSRNYEDVLRSWHVPPKTV